MYVLELRRPVRTSSYVFLSEGSSATSFSIACCCSPQVSEVSSGEAVPFLSLLRVAIGRASNRSEGCATEVSWWLGHDTEGLDAVTHADPSSMQSARVAPPLVSHAFYVMCV